MISRRTLVILALAALVAVIAAALLSHERSQPAPAALVPDLARRMKDVAQIRIQSPQGAVTLARHEGQWLVREKADHPASVVKLREALQGVIELSAPEAKTRDPKLYERVGLDPERGAKPTLLDLRDRSGKAVMTLWIGRARALVTDMQRNEYFVRRGDEDQVWRVEGRLPTDTAPEYWIERQMLSLDRARIRSISVAPREGPRYRVSRHSADKPEFLLEGLGAGEKLEAPMRINALVSAIQNLSADDVLAAPDAASLQQKGRVTAETFDGLQVEMELFFANARRYVSLSAAGSGADTVVQEAARLNDRWRDRTYLLADYQADNLFATRAEIVSAAANGMAPGTQAQQPKPTDKPASTKPRR